MPSVGFRVQGSVNWKQYQIEFWELFPVIARYTKPKGQLPDYEAPVVLKNGLSSVEDFCNSLHKSIMKEFKQ